VTTLESMGSASVDIRDKSRDLLQTAIGLGLDAAEIDVSLESGYSVSVRLGQLDVFEQKSEQSLTLTVYQCQSTASVSTTDLSMGSLNRLLDKAKSLVSCTQEDPCSGLADRNLLAFDYPDLDLYYPWKLSIQDAVELAVRMDDRASRSDSRIVACNSCDISTSNFSCLYANTDGFFGHYPYSVHHLGCSVLAQDDTGKQQYGDYDIHCMPEELCDAEKLAVTVAKETCRMLSPRKVATQQCPVLFAAPVAKGLLSCFFSAINGHNIYRDASFLCGELGQKVFPDFISIVQRPHVKRVLHSAPFDDEGVRTQDLDIVEKGYFNHYICDSYSGRKLGFKSTGNAGGLHNVIVSSSKLSLADLVKKMHRGLFVTELMGQGINLLTGDYSRGASGFWVENGEIQFPVSEVTIAGNLREMFANVVDIACDVDFRGNVKSGSILVENMMLGGE